ncbi:hypothetical protein V6N13_033877 [Hibiscus sabdariffa]
MNFKLKFTGKALEVALWKVARETYLREFEFILDARENAREKPIITMLEIIRTKIMQRIAKKKVEAEKWSTILCPKIQKKLDAAIESSNRTCKGFIGGNSQLNQKSYVHPQTQPSRGRAVPKLPVKRPFGGIRIQDAATSIASEQVPHLHRPSTQPPPITLVRWMMNSGNISMSQPTTANSNFPTNDQ